MTKKLKNLYEEYWIEDPVAVHQNTIGVYHVSSIGNSHQDLEQDGHSGPCLRETYYVYTDPLNRPIKTIGNFHIGDLIHEEIQRIAKINNPATIAEFPLRKWLGSIIISGSIDLIVFTKKGIHIIDIKSASSYTMPKGRYDKNITHFTQVYIYAYWLSTILNIPILSISILYVDKHNLTTVKIREKYDPYKAEQIFKEYEERCYYLHGCLTSNIVPIAEPHKWCKYCDYKERCEEEDCQNVE